MLKLVDFGLMKFNFERNDEIVGSVELFLTTNSKVEKTNENQYAAKQNFKLEGKSEELNAFEFDADYVIVFAVSENGLNEAELKKRIMYEAHSVIYPYLREQVSSTALKAGLGNFVLPNATVDFEDLVEKEETN